MAGIYEPAECSLHPSHLSSSRHIHLHQATWDFSKTSCGVSGPPPLQPMLLIAQTLAVVEAPWNRTMLLCRILPTQVIMKKIIAVDVHLTTMAAERHLRVGGSGKSLLSLARTIRIMARPTIMATKPHLPEEHTGPILLPLAMTMCVMVLPPVIVAANHRGETVGMIMLPSNSVHDPIGVQSTTKSFMHRADNASPGKARLLISLHLPTFRTVCTLGINGMRSITLFAVMTPTLCNHPLNPDTAIIAALTHNH